MIVSKHPTRTTSRWLRAWVMLFAVVALPLGVMYAQDYEAVGKRLRAAVEAGELTGEQARVMLGTLKKAEGGDKDQTPDRATAYLANVKKELGALVEAGKISKEDAAKRYEGTAKAIKQRMAAVEAGKVSEEDAHKKLGALRKEMWPTEEDERGVGDDIGDWVGGIGERLRRAVEAGELSEKEAWAKWHAVKEREIGPKLRAAVETGKMSGEEARAMWREIEKGEHGARLKMAVESGDLSPEEARAKWAEINEADDGKE